MFWILISFSGILAQTTTELVEAPVFPELVEAPEVPALVEAPAEPDRGLTLFAEATAVISEIAPKNHRLINYYKKEPSGALSSTTFGKLFSVIFSFESGIQLPENKYLSNKQKYDNAIEKLQKAANEFNNTQSFHFLGDLALHGYHSFPRNLSLAFDYYKKAADFLGDAGAQRKVGTMYSTGIGVPMDHAKALVYLTFSANQTDLIANQILGYWYYAGIVVPKDCKRAGYYYQIAADQVIQVYQSGPPGGMKLPYPPKLNLAEKEGGVFGYGASGPDYPKERNPLHNGGISAEDVLQYYEFTAEKGDIAAQVLLGQLYYHGSSILQRDHARALTFFKRAMKQIPSEAFEDKSSKKLPALVQSKISHTAEAAGYLGVMYWRGEGVAANAETAKKYFEFGAKHNGARALNGLGLMNLQGVAGLVPDKNKAVEYLSKAAEKLPEAQMNLAELILSTSNDQTASFELFSRASKAGNLFALYRVAEMIMTGRGVSPSCMTAVKNFKSVVQSGDWNDPSILEAQSLVNSDAESALLLFLFAAEKGVEVAQSNAAWIIDKQNIKGSEIFKYNDPYHVALVNWNRAANQDNVDARVKVGDYIYYGLGINESVSTLANLSFYDLQFSQYPITNKSNPTRALDYYKVAADVENHAIAMWNIGYMYEYGIGVVKDLNIAKNYYSRSKLTNPDGYLAVNIALFRIQVKEYMYNLTKTTALKPETTKKPDSNLPVEEIPSQDDQDDYTSDLISSTWKWLITEYDNELYDFAETVFILFLCFVGAGIVWWRHVREMRERARRPQ